MTEPNYPDSDLEMTPESLSTYLKYVLDVSDLSLDMAEHRARGNGALTNMRYRLQQIRADLRAARKA